MPPAAAEDGGSRARCAPFACGRREQQQHQRTRQVQGHSAPAPAAGGFGGGSTARCAPFACGRGEQQQQQQRTRQVQGHSVPAPAAGGLGQRRPQQGCGRRAAGLVGGGIAAAFFVSLERCACVDLRTIGDDCDCEAGDAPLLTRTLHEGGGGGCAARAATAKTKSSTTKRSTSSASASAAGAARKGRRGGGGFSGCCENLR